VGDRGRLWISGLPQVDSVCSPGCVREGGAPGARVRRQERGRPGARTGSRARVCRSCAQRAWLPHPEHRGRNADTAQRLPSAEEASRLEITERDQLKEITMARYLGPKCKLSRREGTDLFLK